MLLLDIDLKKTFTVNSCLLGPLWSGQDTIHCIVLPGCTGSCGGTADLKLKVRTERMTLILTKESCPQVRLHVTQEHKNCYNCLFIQPKLHSSNSLHICEVLLYDTRITPLTHWQLWRMCVCVCVSISTFETFLSCKS